jgi:hypothetical protein
MMTIAYSLIYCHQKRLQESEQDYEEKRRKFQKDEEVEELFKKQIEMERKNKKMDVSLLLSQYQAYC